MTDHLVSETGGLASGRRTDTPHPDHSEDAASGPVERTDRREVEGTCPQATIEPGDGPGYGERQPDRVVRDRLGAVVGHVAYGDPPCGGGVDVHRVGLG